MPKKYIRKSPPGRIYKWCPETSIKSGKRFNRGVEEFCSAIASSQGEDFIVTYVHDTFYDKNNKEHRPAYVECDYVE